LNFLGEARRETIHVELVRLAPLGLDEDLVRGLVGKAHHLVLDRRAVARADAADPSRVERRSMEVRPDQLVGRVGGHCQMARNLIQHQRIGEVRERPRVLVAQMPQHAGEIDRVAMNARRRAGLEPDHAKPKIRQALGYPSGRLLSDSAAAVGRIAHVEKAVQERAGRDDDGVRLDLTPVREHDGARNAPLGLPRGRALGPNSHNLPFDHAQPLGPRKCSRHAR
jgi:hypothetical protein